MAAKKPPSKGEKPQSERFKEAAKEAGVDGEAFERAVKTLTPARHPQRAKARPKNLSGGEKA